MGTFEEAKGRLKQAAGDLVGDPDMKREGTAQEIKGVEERREAQAAMEARQHEENAMRLEQEQHDAERG